jgi:hypothetical protein
MAPPPPLAQHLRHLVLQAQENASEIDREHGVERVLAEFVQALLSRANLPAGNAGIVEGAVDPPIGGNRALDHRCDIGLHGNVAADRDRLAAGRIDQSDGSGRAVLGAVGDRQPRTLARHGQRRRPSDARGAAGHQRHLAIKDACHVFSPAPGPRIDVAGISARILWPRFVIRCL